MQSNPRAVDETNTPALVPVARMHLSDDSNSARRSPANLYLLAAFCVGQAVQVNNGVIHPIALAWIGIAMIALLSAVLSTPIKLFRPIDRASTAKLLSAFVGIQLVETLVWSLRWTPAGAAPWIAASVALMGAGIAIIATGSERRLIVGCALAIAGFALAGFGSIYSTPSVAIDVFEFQQKSAAALLAGANPYAVQFRDIYYPQTGFYGAGVSVNGWLTSSFPYPPMLLLAVLPSKLLAGDVRYAYVVAFMASAIVMIAIKRDRTTMLAAAMLLTLPRNLLMIQVAWTEPMVIACVAVVACCSVKRGRWLFLAVGVLLAMKQYSVVFVPLLPLLWTARNDAIRSIADRARAATRSLLSPTMLYAGIVAAVVTVPFALWSPNAFFKSVVLFHFNQPFFEDALSYTTMLWRLTGIKLGAGPGFLIAAGCIWISWKCVERSAAGFTAALALVLLAFFAFNKQGFCNYYTLVAAVACISGALHSTRDTIAIIAASTDDAALTIAPVQITEAA